MSPAQPGWLLQLFKIRADELSRCLLAFGLFFCLLCAYYILRPIRDSMAITGGVEQLQWLFTGTFFGILLIVPIYGWACNKLPRAWLITGVYGSVIVCLLGFWFMFRQAPDDPWLARGFYVWLSVFNLLMMSVFWSLMVDLFDRDQAHRVFGFIAAGGSLGALVGPLLSAMLVKELGYVQLLLIAVAGFTLVIVFVLCLLKISAAHPQPVEQQTMQGSPFAGMTLVLGSPYLMFYGLFILLLSMLSTFLYFQQAKLVGQALPDADASTQLFAWVDFGVNFLSVSCQVAITGNLVKRFGVTLVLSLFPVLLMLGFISFVIYPMLSIVVAVIVIRRVSAYAFIRPCREMLFTALDREMKYKAKNFIDTVVYRGGDALSSWFYTACVGLGLTMSGTAIVGASIAGLCALTGFTLGRKHDQR